MTLSQALRQNSNSNYINKYNKLKSGLNNALLSSEPSGLKAELPHFGMMSAEQLAEALGSCNLGEAFASYLQVDGLVGFFQDKLTLASFHEWGLPHGQGGYGFVVRLLAAATRGLIDSSRGPMQCLWASDRKQDLISGQMKSASRRSKLNLTKPECLDLEVFPPAWGRHGVDFDYLQVTECNNLLQDLNPTFYDPYFSIIVLHTSRKLKNFELSFLQYRARVNKQLILLVRPSFIGNKQGNVWAATRLNCWQPQKNTYRLFAVKGLDQKKIDISLSTTLAGEELLPC